MLNLHSYPLIFGKATAVSWMKTASELLRLTESASTSVISHPGDSPGTPCRLRRATIARRRPVAIRGICRLNEFMIHDAFARIAVYRTLSGPLTTAIDYIQTLGLAGLSAMPIGKHLIEGDRVFASVMEYATKSSAEARWESHRKYVDVQIMLAGDEQMRVADVTTMKEKSPYDAEKDATFFHPPAASNVVVVAAGQFAIFFPHDAHQPSLAIAGPTTIRKVVFKVMAG